MGSCCCYVSKSRAKSIGNGFDMLRTIFRASYIQTVLEAKQFHRNSCYKHYVDVASNQKPYGTAGGKQDLFQKISTIPVIPNMRWTWNLCQLLSTYSERVDEHMPPAEEYLSVDDEVVVFPQMTDESILEDFQSYKKEGEEIKEDVEEEELIINCQTLTPAEAIASCEALQNFISRVPSIPESHLVNLVAIRSLCVSLNIQKKSRPTITHRGRDCMQHRGIESFDHGNEEMENETYHLSAIGTMHIKEELFGTTRENLNASSKFEKERFSEANFPYTAQNKTRFLFLFYDGALEDLSRLKFSKKNLHLPPAPIFTCWGKWLQAVKYYSENIDSVQEIILVSEEESQYNQTNSGLLTETYIYDFSCKCPKT
ncbi:hypothetical protein C0J52_14423 [Blattella germanica]|nr:hypothetical protein C0J52_14423 [Blattella germanica]